MSRSPFNPDRFWNPVRVESSLRFFSILALSLRGSSALATLGVDKVNDLTFNRCYRGDRPKSVPPQNSRMRKINISPSLPIGRYPPAVGPETSRLMGLFPSDRWVCDPTDSTGHYARSCEFQTSPLLDLSAGWE